MVADKMAESPWPDTADLEMSREERKHEYALRFAAIMREMDPELPLDHILNGPCGGWETAEMEIRIEEMADSGMTDDEIQGTCTAVECMTGRKTAIIGDGPVVP
jgi:hypothetical protein